jgi:two-component system CheB/CheR fusion protein
MDQGKATVQQQSGTNISDTSFENARSLHEDAEQFRLLMEAVTDYAIFLIDPDGRVSRWNAGAERILGYQENEVIGRPFAILFTREDIEAGQPEKELHKAAATGRVSDERWQVRKNGSRLWVTGVATALRDEDGRLRGFAKVMRDNTLRRWQDEALRVSERRFRSLIEHSQDAIVLMDASGTIRYVSPAVERILDYKPEELIGHNAFDLMHPEDLEKTRELFSRIVGGPGTSLSAEFRYRGKDGAWRWVEGTGTNLLNEPGIEAIVGNYRDVSDRKRLEAELHERMDQLTDADRRKDEFLATLAHELRNPLAPVRNGLHIIKQLERHDTTIAKVRDIMERQVQHLARLVDDLLDVARISYGRIQLRKEPVNLATVVKSAVDTVRPAADCRHQELTVTLPKEPIEIEADPLRLEQVLCNLLTNASKYTPEEGKLELAAERNGRQVVLRVRDNGLGIPSDMLKTIFEPFQQTNRLLGRSHGGLGIGLTLVRRLTELHGGTVEASSSGLGQGSEFVVRLPLGKNKGTAKRGSATPFISPGSKRHILVVDDNADTAKSLAMLLRLEGHEVRVALSGPAALEAALEDKPEIVFLDINMPGMDGYEVAQRLRELPGLDGCMLVALTGYGQEQDRRQTREIGFACHMVKPVDPNELKKLLADPAHSGKSHRSPKR